MEIHLGKKIEEIFNERGMKPAYFAEQLNTVPRNIYSVFKRNEFKTTQLQKISEILQHDFFQYIRPNLKNYELPEGRAELAEELKSLYATSSTKVQVTVELDGSEKNLKKWVNIISDFSRTIKDNFSSRYEVV